MERRKFLRRAGATVAAVGSLSGCTSHRLQKSEREPPLVDGISEEEVHLPVSQPLGVAEAGIENGATAEIQHLGGFESYLVDVGLTVESLEERVEDGERLLTLEYVAEETFDQGLMHHLGIVAGGYATLVESGHDAEKLEAHLLDSSMQEFGEYEIRRRWAVEFNEGELTAREYAHEIAVTVETT